MKTITIDDDLFESLAFLLKKDSQGKSEHWTMTDTIGACIQQRFDGDWDVDALKQWYKDNVEDEAEEITKGETA